MAPPRRRGALVNEVLSSNLVQQLNQNSNPRLRFPIDYDQEYPGSITFTAVEDNTFNLQNITQGIQNETRATELAARATEIRNTRGVDGALANAAAGKLARDAQTLRQEATKLFGGDKSQKTLVNTKFDGDPRGSVSLYLPQSLAFNDGVEYSGTDLGTRGAGALGALQTNPTAAGVLAAQFGDIPLADLITKLADNSSDILTSPTALLAVQRVLSKNSEIGAALETATGVTLNPNKRSLLRGVALRSFRFQFKLIPTSAQESERIKQIILFFRENMYPEDIAPGGVTVGYKYPYKFIIQMRYGGRKVATGILPCFLQTFETNYNPNAMGMMRDGNFPEIDISMGFIEHRTLRKKDIQGGY